MKVTDSYRVFYMEKTIEQLREENQRYKQALEFYANECHVEYSIETGEWDGDNGEIARQALEGEE